MTEITGAPRRLRRPLDDRVIAGVCSGLGRYFALDPTLIRIGWVILVLLGGSGGLAYLLAWLVIPDDQGQRSMVPLVLIIVGVILPFILVCLFLMPVSVITRPGM